MQLSQDKTNKLCNVTPGTVVQTLTPTMEIEPEYYLVAVEAGAPDKVRFLVNLASGIEVACHNSSHVKILSDACIVLDPIDRE